MNGKGIAILGIVGLGALALGGGGRRGSSDPRAAEAAARRKLRATPAQVQAPGFVPAGGGRLTGDARVAGVERELVGATLDELDELAVAQALVGASTPRPNHARARKLAGPLSRALRSSSPGALEREDVRAFQAAAGLPPSGHYDTAVAAALAHYGIRNPPAPWFAAELDGGAQ